MKSKDDLLKRIEGLESKTGIKKDSGDHVITIEIVGAADSDDSWKPDHDDGAKYVGKRPTPQGMRDTWVKTIKLD